MAPNEVVEKKRKAKRTGMMKKIRQYRMSAMSYILPVIRFVPSRNFIILSDLSVYVRYSTFPALFYFSLHYTEPKPTFLELVNPFF